MTISEVAGIIGSITVLVSAISSLIVLVVGFVKIVNSQKCLLRSSMLSIYYSNFETKKIRQYEFENFIYLYEGYKKLKGNSFIDKIYKEINTWEVIS